MAGTILVTSSGKVAPPGFNNLADDIPPKRENLDLKAKLMDKPRGSRMGTGLFT